MESQQQEVQPGLTRSRNLASSQSVKLYLSGDILSIFFSQKPSSLCKVLVSYFSLHQNQLVLFLTLSLLFKEFMTPVSVCYADPVSVSMSTFLQKKNMIISTWITVHRLLMKLTRLQNCRYMIQKLPSLGLWARLAGVKDGVHGREQLTLTCDRNFKLHTHFFRLLSHMVTLQYSLSDYVFYVFIRYFICPYEESIPESII